MTLNRKEVPRSEYPRPQFVRSIWFNLNGEWEFAVEIEPTMIRIGNVRPSCQPSRSPSSASSKANSHSPLRLNQMLRANCGRGYSERGISFLLRVMFSAVSAALSVLCDNDTL